MPRPKGYGRAMRAANDAVRQERMVVGDVTSGASAKKTKPKASKPGAGASRKATPTTPSKAAQTPSASDWSQAVGLLVHRCSPATRDEIIRVASALAAEVKSPGRKAVYTAMSGRRNRGR